MKRLACILILLWPALADAALGNPGSTAMLKGAAASASFPSGATHYWAFENNLNDGVGAFNLSDGGVVYAAGKNSQAIECGDGASAASSSALPITGAFSIVCWVWVFDSGSSIINAGLANGINLSVASGSSEFKAGATSDTINAGGAGANDVWALAVLTYDGSGNAKASVNGGTFVTGAVTVEDVNGNILFNGNEATAKFDECAFFARALTQQEVSDIWNSGAGRYGP